MTRAKDISKIVTDADLSGTLDVTGTVTTGGLNSSVSRTSGANATAITLSDNVTGAQTSGFGTRIVGASNNNGAVSAIGFEADGGTNNDTAISLYTQPQAGTLRQRFKASRDGDISFFEDTGTTAKLFWDASEEGLAIGDSAVDADASGLYVLGTDPTGVDKGQLVLKGTATSGAANTGASITFKGHNGSGNRGFGSIQVLKENSTVGNNDTYMRFSTRDNADGYRETMRIDSSGNLLIGQTDSNARLASTSTTNKQLSLRYTGVASYYTSVDSSGNYVIDKDGSERMRIDSNGNVNVGVPTADTSSNNISITGGLAGSQLNAQLKFFGKSVSNTGVTYETARISGGSTSGAYSLSGGLVFSTSSNNGSNVLTLAERMRIDSSGNVGIGATPVSGQRLYVLQNTNNTVCQISNSDTAGFTSDALFIYNTRTTSNSTYNHISAFNGSFTNGFFVRDSGNAENTNDSYGPIASDERLKQDIVDCGEQWNDLKNLRIRKFRYRNNPEDHLQIGCIAQEAEQVSPGLISRRVPTKHEILVNPDLGNLVDDLDRPIEDEEGNITGYEQKVETDTEVLSFKSSVLFWKATKALQEAMTRIETLETTNTALEARITALENGE